MRRILFSLILIITLVGQLFLATGLRALSASNAGAAREDARALLLPPTTRPSLTPSLTPSQLPPSPTPPPHATDTPVPPTNTPIPPTAVIAKSVVNLRWGPGIIYDTLGVAHRDERFLITGQFPPGDWLRIDYNGIDAWVYRPLVTLEGAVDQIPPVTDIPPTPTFTPTLTPTSTPTPGPPTATPAQYSGPTPTATAPPTATPTPGAPQAIIIAPNASIRQGPGLIYDEIGQAGPDDAYPVTGRFVTGDWLQVVYQGKAGWVFRQQVKLEGDVARSPVIEKIPPTPTFTPAAVTPLPTAAPLPTPTLAPTPVPAAGGPPTWLLVIGGLIVLALAGGILLWFMRRQS